MIDRLVNICIMPPNVSTETVFRKNKEKRFMAIFSDIGYFPFVSVMSLYR